MQGYSTLHCIRFRGVEVRMDRNQLQQAAHKLGDMPTNMRSISDDGESTSTCMFQLAFFCYSSCLLLPSLLFLVSLFFLPLLLLFHLIIISFSLFPPSSLTCVATRPIHHRFYVYCKNPCKAMSPGKLRVRCADCKKPSFVLLAVHILHVLLRIDLIKADTRTYNMPYTLNRICSTRFELSM